MEPEVHYRIQLSLSWASLIQIFCNTDYLFFHINLVRFCTVSIEVGKIILLLYDLHTVKYLTQVV